MTDAIDFREEEALERLGNETELLMMLINTFLNELDNYIALLNDAATSRETERIATAAHRLKGACATIGLHCGFQRAKALEMDAKDNATFPELLAQQQALTDHLHHRAKPFLTDWLNHKKNSN